MYVTLTLYWKSESLLILNLKYKYKPFSNFVPLDVHLIPCIIVSHAPVVHNSCDRLISFKLLFRITQSYDISFECIVHMYISIKQHQVQNIPKYHTQFDISNQQTTYYIRKPIPDIKS